MEEVDPTGQAEVACQADKREATGGGRRPAKDEAFHRRPAEARSEGKWIAKADGAERWALLMS